mmetsp:Transcript_96589/g.171738  ORF Transcript_96589/g.171738 Transcript_96589/m.171738 type:complete len:396 (-) Transcript_96589:259-1446(-)|eukprot:CAMPEP_0197635348 /NCGR_PEP_ID=MMETSP1338-20131121/11192_1 /TAXON_ID=43686 ORGANISM="Pelagodinium beii, Strain RCC1491" /NCGR_SAMPLE_ID=MMETSP1338 /ASSEMBLY_ACC=CAM_ASM_000754 /LENGTH=395 /DNA_ID=CAMNT_0043207375 /DNA_START=154 /DNA_END=1341 /DNA_ORIENTATION=-
MPHHPPESWVVTAHGFLMPQTALQAEPIAHGASMAFADLGDSKVVGQPLDLGPEFLGLRTEWWVLIATAVALLLLDGLVLSRLSHNFKTDLGLTMFWLFTGFVFNMHIFVKFGHQQAVYWMTGYSLEWMLSVDNLCVFSLILTAYRTPQALVHKALFFGILGCMGLRLGFFMAVGNILQHRFGLQLALGLFLLLSGLRGLVCDDDDDEDVANSRLVRGLQTCLGSRLEPSYDLAKKRLFVVRNNKVCATLLVLVILLLELTDVMFALDSVSAKIAAVPDRYIAYSSTVMAVFGLRAAFFILHSLTAYVEAMKKGVAFVVAYIGVQLIVGKFVLFPPWSTCVVSALALSISALCSACANKYAARREKSQKEDQPVSSDEPKYYKESVKEAPQAPAG